MAWNFNPLINWVSAPRNPAAADLDNIAKDLRTWGGNVDAATKNLSNLGTLTFDAVGYINSDLGIGGSAIAGCKESVTLAALDGAGGTRLRAQTLKCAVVNADTLRTDIIRKSAGGTWDSAAWRTQRVVDAVAMSYIEHGFGRLAFGVDDAEKAALTASGFGLGTQNPVGNFHIWLPFERLVDQMTLGSSAGVGFALTGNGAFGLYGGVSASGHSWLQAGRTDSAAAYALVLQAAGGNVGVGKTPAARLDVAGSGSFDGGLTCQPATDRKTTITNDGTGEVYLGVLNGAGSAWQRLSLAASYLRLATQSVGHVIQHVGTGACPDGELANNNMSIWFDEGNNRLAFKCKTSGGVVKSGYVAVS